MPRKPGEAITMRNEKKKLRVKKAVQQFSQLWTDSLKDRYEAAVIYYETVSSAGSDKSVQNEFHSHPKYKDWSSLRWKLLYLTGRGDLLRDFLDVHNYSLGILCSKLPLATQRSIFKNGLHLVSLEHPGGCIVPMKNVTRKMIMHCFDIENGGRPYPAEMLREISFDAKVKRRPIVFEDDAKGELRVRTTKAVVLYPELLREILTHKNDNGKSVLTTSALYSIIHELENN